MEDNMNQEYPQTNNLDKNEFKCKCCGASVEFKAGTDSTECPYCGTRNEIDTDGEIEELDFDEYVALVEKGETDLAEIQKINTVTCKSCGAVTTLEDNVVSGECPFCGTKFVVNTEATSTVIKPKSVLPFKIDSKQAFELFDNWLKKLKFAPSDLKKKSAQTEKFSGIYLPYWTYDSTTSTWYSGERGDIYYETRTVMKDGKETEERVQKIRWTRVTGQVFVSFDDILIPASFTVDRDKLSKIAPWHLRGLAPYDDRFLAGFRAETYQVGLQEGFERAKQIMKDGIEDEICGDIGGDQQKINHMNTSYSDTTFKHTLLPIWISAYRYKNKVYQFIINGESGKIVGDRPYSFWKIAGLVLGIIAVIAALYFIFR